MPRPLRIQYEGAWYHVMNRGINRQLIFKCNAHRDMFLSLLSEMTAQYQVEIHAYCLMNNHYHLLIRTPLANLSRCMQYLDGVYTQRYNRSTKRDGALFRGRYKAIIIEADSYLLQVSRYIHLNPVEAKICQHPHDYAWSSYRSYVSTRQSISWLETSMVLEQIGGINPPENYAKFVLNGNDKVVSDFYHQQQLPSVLGSKNFIDDHLSGLDGAYISAVKTDYNRSKPLPDTAVVISCVMKHFQLTRAMLNESTQGKRNWARMIAVYALKHLSQLTHQQVAEHFDNLAPSNVSTLLNRCKRLLESDSCFNDHAAKVRQMICQHDQC